jgi:hypothetical protein
LVHGGHEGGGLLPGKSGVSDRGNQQVRQAQPVFGEGNRNTDRLHVPFDIAGEPCDIGLLLAQIRLVLAPVFDLDSDENANYDDDEFGDQRWPVLGT